MHNAETDQGMSPGFLKPKQNAPTNRNLAGVMVYIVTLVLGIGASTGSD